MIAASSKDIIGFLSAARNGAALVAAAASSADNGPAMTDCPFEPSRALRGLAFTGRQYALSLHEATLLV